MRSTDGVLLVDKPAGLTSHDVVAAARRALGERRIGHAGTLDPFATGLLVLLVGRATRLLPYVEGEPKVYDATIRFGAETDTDDVTGTPTRQAAPPLLADLESSIDKLTGVIAQLPPAYSAKKVGGVRSYAAARRGDAPELAPVPVAVHEWRVHARRDMDLDVTVVCGGGTYVRALARDLGRLAGSAAHLAALRRVSSGPFHVRDAHSLERIRGDVPPPPLRSPLDAIPSLPVERLDAAAVERVARGQTVDATAPGDRVAMVDVDGSLVALGERAGTRWQPRVVLSNG
ncbi:MAG: tRNA pseudouridine(55) synthase TruB [Gemmatimonadaceae bacterium]